MMDKTIILAILTMISAPISLFSSIIVMVMIKRSTSGLSTTQHRLLFALSITDMLGSLAMAFATFPSPKGAEGIWMASGNTTTCELQGFFTILSTVTAPAYNAALCIFYLLKVRYNTSDDIISTKIEPFLHAIPIALGGSYSFVGLVRGYLNPLSIFCSVKDYPAGCNVNPKVACERGEGLDDDMVINVLRILSFIVVPLIIFTVMPTIYLTVLWQEQRNMRFGRGTLQTNTTAGEDRNRTSARSNPIVRLVMYRAMAYASAWLATYLLPLISLVGRIVNPSFIKFSVLVPTAFLLPLQGFFNFLIYIYPKIIHIRQSNPETSIPKALLILLKGPPPRPAATIPNRRGGNP